MKFQMLPIKMWAQGKIIDNLEYYCEWLHENVDTESSLWESFHVKCLSGCAGIISNLLHGQA